LTAAKAAPYARPVAASCDALFANIRTLDEVLGTDLDAPPTDANPGLVERAGTFAAEQATNAVRRSAEGVVPFRSWVRKLTGAERFQAGGRSDRSGHGAPRVFEGHGGGAEVRLTAYFLPNWSARSSKR
jgi:hypothetical protein